MGRVFKIEECKYCDEPLESNTFCGIHNFIRHYEEWKTQPVEEISVVQEKIGSIRIFKILLVEQFNERNFFWFTFYY